MNTDITTSQDIKPLNKADAILAIENLCKHCAKKVDELKHRIRSKKVDLESLLLNDTEYSKLMKDMKDLQEKKKSAKARIMGLPEVFKLSQELDDLKSEKKSVQLRFSDYVFEFETKTGQLPLFEDDEGNELIIVKSAKLKKKPKKWGHKPR